MIPHTPTPWYRGNAQSNFTKHRIEIRDANNQLVCTVTNRKFVKEENEIVDTLLRCVNEREGLLAALKECHGYFLNRPGNWEIQLANICGKVLAQAEQVTS